MICFFCTIYDDIKVFTARRANYLLKWYNMRTDEQIFITYSIIQDDELCSFIHDGSPGVLHNVMYLYVVGKTWLLNLLANRFWFSGKKVLTCGMTWFAGLHVSGPSAHFHMRTKNYANNFILSYNSHFGFKGDNYYVRLKSTSVKFSRLRMKSNNICMRYWCYYCRWSFDDDSSGVLLIVMYVVYIVWLYYFLYMYVQFLEAMHRQCIYVEPNEQK